MDINSLRHKVSTGVAPELGAEYRERDDTWRAECETADGIRLIFNASHKPGGVSAYLNRPGKPGETRRLGAIGINLEARTAAAIARDIERRLLPLAREKAAAAREEWQTQDFDGANLARVAEELNAIPHCQARAEDIGTDRQRIRVFFHRSEGGSVYADVTAGGRVYLERASLYGAAPVDQLKELLTILNRA